LKIARLHAKIANQRKDFQHKLSRNLVENHGAIYLEDLNVKGMVKNHNLAKHISDAAWGQFTRFLAYKGEWYGCWVEKIDRFAPSSKLCSICGFKNTELTLSDREWVCPKCGTTHDRDLNAAVNILAFARAGTARDNAGGVDVSLAIRELSAVKPEAPCFS
jgi:putative transposase